MDGLTDEERVLAWIANWHPSFSGKAIVNGDFTFRSVNPQFCKILGVTPAELVDQSFVDLTPEPIKTLDKRNAELVKAGQIQSYLIPKTYEFPNGKRKDVTLLVNGVYHQDTNEFLFFVSTIMERATLKTSVVPSQKQTLLPDWVDGKKAGWTIMTALGLGIAYTIEKLIGKLP